MVSKAMIDFEHDQMSVETVPEEGLSRVSALATRQLTIEQELAALATRASELSKELLQVSEKDLPEAMTALGLLEIKLKDGSMVKIGVFYHASIPKAREREAFDWLRADGSDSLIKNDITVTFGKGEDETAEQFVQELVKAGLQFKKKTTVHAQTLKAFVREKAESGHPVPEPIFGVHVQTKALISRSGD